MTIRIKMDYGLNFLLANSGTCAVKCLFDFIFYIYFLCVYVSMCVCVYAPQHVWKLRITFRNQFCPSFM